MADGIIDATVRVEGGKLGKFVQDMAMHIPYAHIIGHTIAVPSNQKALPPPKTIELPAEDQSEIEPKRRGRPPHKLSAFQKNALHAIANGATTLQGVREATGIGRQIKRVINNLIRFKRIKGNDGTYRVIDK